MGQTQTYGYAIDEIWHLGGVDILCGLNTQNSSFEKSSSHFESVYKGIHVVFEESGVEYQGGLDLV
jgi:hypothetical protein